MGRARDDPTANRWTAEYQYEEESNFNNGRTDGGNSFDDYVIASLDQATWNGVNWASLPATTFEYGRTTDHLITAVNTGYGGRVEYTYGEGDDHHQTTAKKYHYVTQRLTRDGSGNDVLDTYDYAAPVSTI